MQETQAHSLGQEGPPPPTGEGNGNPLQYYCLGESLGQRSLVGYSPWGYSPWTGKELRMTEQLTLYVLLIIPRLPRLQD